MKRIKNFIMAICLVTVILFSGCASEEITASADEFVLAVTLETQSPIYRLSCEYYLDGELMGGLSVENADGDPLEGRKTFRFSGENFPEDADLSGFSANFFVTTSPGAADLYEIASHDGQLFSQGEIIFNPVNGTVYPVRLTETEGCFLTSLEEDVSEV